MNFFDITAPFYERLHFGGQKTFLALSKIGHFEKNDRVLDLGGGVGRIAKFLVGQTKEITVVDISSRMIKYCQRHQGLICLLASAENLAFPENYFDKIIIIDAFHHFQNQEKACQKIRRVLKPKGKVILEEFYFGRFFTSLAEKFEKLIGAKSKLHSPDSLAGLFQKQQFKTQLVNENKMVYYLIGEKTL